jgi:YesN/AraC family two-component response regulator
MKLEGIEKSDIFIRNDFDLRFLANHLGKNVSYLSEIINTYKKVSFKQYLFKLRMEYLIEKLQNSVKYNKYSIDAIGKEIGYTNPSSFTRAFKK